MFDIIVAMAMMNYNSAPHSATREAPFTILTGTDLRLPTFFHATSGKKINRCNRVKALTKMREEAFHQILSTQRAQDQFEEREYFEENELVMVKLTPMEMATRAHIITGNQNGPKWSLPRRIIKINKDRSQLVVKDLLTGKERIVATNNAKKFMCDTTSHAYEHSKRMEIRDEIKAGLP